MRDFHVENRSNCSCNTEQFDFLCRIHSKREIDRRDLGTDSGGMRLSKSAGVVAVGLDYSLKRERNGMESQRRRKDEFSKNPINLNLEFKKHFIKIVFLSIV